MKTLYLIITALTLFITVEAQNIFSFKEKNNVAYCHFGIEPTSVLAAGYIYSFHVNCIKRNIAVFGELSSPVRMFGANNYEIKAGGIIPVVRYRSLGITYGLNFSTGHVETKNFHSQKFAVANKLLLGIFKNKWYLAFTGEYEKIFRNKITHTQYYLDYIYPEAKDGWYKGAGGNIQLGLEVGFTIKDMIDINFDLKVPKSEKFDSYRGSPGHTNLTVGYRF